MDKKQVKPTNKLRQKGVFALSIGVAVFLLYFVLRKAGVSGIAEFISRTSVWVVIAGVLVYTAEMFVRAYRWKEILKINRVEVTLMDSFWGYSLGNGLNIFMPAKLGDLARSYYLKHKYGSKYIDTIPTTLMDRFYDIVGIYLVLLFDMIFIISTIKMERWLTILLAVGLAALIAGFLVLEILYKNKKLIRLIPTDLLKGLAESMLLSYGGALRNPVQFLKLSAISFVVWGLECVTAFVIFYGAGLQVSPMILVFGLMVATLTKAIPITPGGIGVFEGAMVVCFAMFGIVDAELAVGAAVFHLILNSYGALVAVYILIKRGIKTNDIVRGQTD